MGSSYIFKATILVLINICFLKFSGSGQCCSCRNYGPELVYNGDFSLGNVGFSSGYIFAEGASPGFYGITTNANFANPDFWGDCVDHSTGSGNFIWYDVSPDSGVNMWTQQITGIATNSTYIFSCWINTLDPRNPATIQFSINGQLVGNSATSPSMLCTWVQKCFTWNSGNNTTATITISNQSDMATGNDIGIDDISFRSCSSFARTFFSDTSNVLICQGQSYQLPNGTMINVAGTYIDTIQTADGCDSIKVIKLNIKSPGDSTLNVSICQGNLYFGYSSTGTYIDTLTSANGCDSMRILNLTVKANSSIMFNQSICQGQSYLGHTTGGIYIDTLIAANGCDSIRTVNLTVKATPFTMADKSICQGQSYFGHITSGTYIDTLIAADGCDSIRTIDLTVKANTFATLNQFVCKGQNFLGHTTSGTYIDTLVNANGCDSIIRTNLTALADCEVYFPTAFTPNNDGKNDLFKILNANPNILTNYRLTIYNRWGQKMFETKNYNEGWNGMYDGYEQPLGVYVWYSSFYLFGKFNERKGFVSLIR